MLLLMEPMSGNPFLICRRQSSVNGLPVLLHMGGACRKGGVLFVAIKYEGVSWVNGDCSLVGACLGLIGGGIDQNAITARRHGLGLLQSLCPVLGRRGGV